MELASFGENMEDIDLDLSSNDSEIGVWQSEGEENEKEKEKEKVAKIHSVDISKKSKNVAPIQSKSNFRSAFKSMSNKTKAPSSFKQQAIKKKNSFDDDEEEEEKNDKEEKNKDEEVEKFNPEKKSSLINRRQKFSLTLSNDTTNININFLKRMSDRKEKNENKERKYQFFLSNHPLSWENNGINIFLRKFKSIKNPNCNYLFTNLSSANLAFMIRTEKKKNPNLPIYCDTSTPFLYFFSEKIKNGKTKYKSSPPIREKENLSLLLKILKINAIDVVSSGHLEVPYQYKCIVNGNFRRAFNGHSCIGNNLQVLWSKLYCNEKNRFKKLKNEDFHKDSIIRIMKFLVEILSFNPAKISHLINEKGSIEKGKDADIVIWNPFNISKYKKNEIPLNYPENYLFLEKKFYGVVKKTILRGKIVFDSDNQTFEKYGKILSYHN